MLKNQAPELYHISTFYKFKNLSDIENTKHRLETAAKDLKIDGLMILGKEGLNSTFSAQSEREFSSFKKEITDILEDPELFFKDTTSPVKPFRRFKVKVRPEIVTLGTPELVPTEPKHSHLTPEEWDWVLKNEKDFLLVDTRNWYEYEIGTFKGAVNPNINVFTEFPKFMHDNNLDKDKKVLIFCTGGIRCERGILELERQGFKNVFQLEGGIINYLKKFPNEEFKGECFVFDHRVALNQNLEASKTYSLCPHCGQPGDQLITCVRCDSQEKICSRCLELEIKKDTCSKNCYHQWKTYRKKGAKQI